ncbi:MAG TPA: NAD-dependent epimerase/dehydratase family protein [Anaeromyxobacteraceae bacterium]|nr:NAD-dependent epimerase/dehydratase family protein [Anaeromyxobacteraceae bacterium]
MVTGAAGFIGSRVAAGCLERGWEVLGVIRESSPPDWLARACTGLTRLDWDDDLAMRSALVGVDVVVHAAAFVPPVHGLAGPIRRCFEVNTVLTGQVVRACAASGVRLIYLSSAAAYKPSAEPVLETAPLYPDPRVAPYAASKLAGEILVEGGRQALGLAALSLRVGSCYGPGMSPRAAVARFMEAAAAGRPVEVWDGGTPSCDYVFVEDVAAIALAAAESGRPGIYNVGSGASHSLLALAEAVVQVHPGTSSRVEVRPVAGVPRASFPALVTRKARQEWGLEARDLMTGLRLYREAIVGGGS